MVGPSIGPYRILERLGAGGMGEVYLAEDTRLRRRVALKTVSERRLGDPDARRRLLREARAAANLNHPNIAAIYDILELDDRAHIVMEYVRGDTLAALVKDGPLSPARALEIALQLADALDAAHAMGIVHRDLKPSNVVLTPDGKAKVLDFGLAKSYLIDESDPTPSSVDITPDGPHVIGTPPYMSPEQLRGQPVDARSDLYSFGVVLFEMLTGRRPHQGRDPYLLLTAILNEPPPSARAINPSVPAELDAIVARAMAREPASRYASAAALRTDLTQAAGSLSDVATRSESWIPSSARVQSWRWPAIATLMLLATAVGLRMLLAWLPNSSAPVPADAQRWYEQGTAALGEGAYLTASKRLEQAISLHDAYPLAHARLAEARAELDDDRAKDSLLYVQKLVPDLSRLPRVDALYLEGIRAMVSRRFPDAIQAYSALAAEFPSQSPGHFDLGRSYEANDEIAKAVASYEKAAALDPSSPAPHMRLGELRGQERELDAALASFSKAESLYQAASNLEGVTEVACRRGALFNTLDRSKEARAELERALKLAAQTQNSHQRIRALLQLSSVAATEGATEEAERHASEAVTLARGMDALTASGLVDLGNVFLMRGNYEQTDRYFSEALGAARRLKARRTEARALLSLGSLRVTQGRAADAMPFLDAAREFYVQRGFQRQASLAYMLVGQVHDLRGEFEAAVKAFDSQLGVAKQLEDRAAIAQAHLLLGLSQLRWERLPHALQNLRAGASIYRVLAHGELAYCLVNEAEALLRMSRSEDARTVLEELRRLATGHQSVPEPLRPRIDLLTARLAASEQRLREAATVTQSVLNHPATDESLRAEATVVLASIRSRSDVPEEAGRLANDALRRARALDDPVITVQALLVLSTVELAANRAAAALGSASDALAESERHGLLLSAWQACTLAALAATAAGDGNQAKSHNELARERQALLAIAWGESEVRRLPGALEPHSRSSTSQR